MADEVFPESPDQALKREKTASFNNGVQEKKEILTITIEISENQEAKILVCEGDEPRDLAVKFCKENMLPEDIIPKLEEEISKNIQAVKDDTPLPPTQYEEEGYVQKSNDHSPIVSISNEYSQNEIRKITSEARGPKDYNEWKNGMEKKMKNLHMGINKPFISEASKRIMSTKNRNAPVFERLHNDAVIKQKNKSKLDISQNQISQTTPKRDTSADIRSSVNYGLIQYEKGLRMKEETEKRNQMEKKKKEEKEMESIQNKPIINNYLVERKGKLEDNLIKNWNQIKEKREKEKAKLFLEEKSQCSFQPRINKASEKLALERSKQISVEMNNASFTKYDFLYEEAKRRQNQQLNAVRAKDSECTFKPNINVSKNYEFKSTEKRKPAQSDYYSRDHKTGQELFKPKVGRAPKIERNNAGLPIGDYLYNQMGVKEVESKKAKDDAIRKEQDSLKLSANLKTEELINKVKAQVFDELFTCLDSDEDGIISTLKINVEGIPSDILLVISPLLAEIEENDHTLKRNEFTDACHRLYATLNPHQKQILTNFRKKQRADKNIGEYTFKPSINNKSIELLEKGKQESIAESSQSFINRKEAKLEELRKLKKDREVEGCTFHPIINQKSWFTAQSES